MMEDVRVLIAVSRSIRRAYMELGAYGISGGVTISLPREEWLRFHKEAEKALENAGDLPVDPRPTKVGSDEVHLLGGIVRAADSEAARFLPCRLQDNEG